MQLITRSVFVFENGHFFSIKMLYKIRGSDNGGLKFFAKFSIQSGH